MSARPMWRRVNWPLWIGAGLVAFIVLVAWAGPALAPNSPYDTSFFERGHTRWYRPPFPPMAVPGYPLGSDALGRDVLSMLLWAIRPTLRLLLLIALARVAIGTVVGLAAGWSQGAVARALDSIIGAALAPPVLVVALLTVAALQDRMGANAFVLGLTLTGWAETARGVREQARLVKGEQYIEASHSLGASSLYIAVQHGLRQILPFLLVVGAFEVSHTLLALGTLGFLGYYVGGEVWVPVDDNVFARFSDAPELGQMLGGNSTEFFAGPWKMLASGTVVALLILGFNLLGSGLQRAVEQHRFSYSPLLAPVYYVGLVLDWTTRPVRWILQLVPVPRTPLQKGAAVLLLLAMVTGGAVGWDRYQERRQAAPESALVASVLDDAAGFDVPGEHFWASALRDPYGTRWSQARGPARGGAVWKFEADSAFTGGPVVAADGTLYLASAAGTLFALNSSGDLLWRQTLPVSPLGAPALAADGVIYVADDMGGLAAFGPDGEPRWRVEGDGSSTLADPIVGPDGAVFYATSGNARAVSRDGELLWESVLDPETFLDGPLLLDPTGEWLFAGDLVLRASDGVEENRINLQAERIFVGADGALYYQIRSKAVTRWKITGSRYAALQATISWRDGGVAGSASRTTGVAPDGHIWLQTDSAEAFNLEWRTRRGKLSGLYSVPLRDTRLIGLDRAGTAFACGERGNLRLICVAIPANSAREAWNMELPASGRVTGGAIAPSRLYLTTEGGVLHAIGRGP